MVLLKEHRKYIQVQSRTEYNVSLVIVVHSVRPACKSEILSNGHWAWSLSCWSPTARPKGSGNGCVDSPLPRTYRIIACRSTTTPRNSSRTLCPGQELELRRVPIRRRSHRNHRDVTKPKVAWSLKVTLPTRNRCWLLPPRNPSPRRSRRSVVATENYRNPEEEQEVEVNVYNYG